MENTKKLNIGITCYPHAGGSGIVATELGKNLFNNGHNVRFISSARPFRLMKISENIPYHEVEEISYPLFASSPYLLMLASKMAKISIEHSLDILHVHYAIPHSIAASIAKQIIISKGCKPPKIVTTLHGTDVTFVGNLPGLKDLTATYIDLSDAVSTVSEFLKIETIREFNTNADFIKVIPNFIDSQEFNPSIPSGISYLKKDDEKIITHISNFRPVKRIQDVIEIFALINSQVNSRLVLVGDGPEAKGIRELACKSGLCSKVEFLGEIKEIAPILTGSDLFLLPSESESFGLSALEAMACGVPVIGSSGSGINEVVEEGITGFLSSVGSVNDMANNAIKILQNKELNKKLSINSAKRAIEVFPTNIVTEMYLDLYYKALNK